MALGLRAPWLVELHGAWFACPVALGFPSSMALGLRAQWLAVCCWKVLVLSVHHLYSDPGKIAMRPTWFPLGRLMSSVPRSSSRSTRNASHGTHTMTPRTTARGRRSGRNPLPGPTPSHDAVMQFFNLVDRSLLVSCQLVVVSSSYVNVYVMVVLTLTERWSNAVCLICFTINHPLSFFRRVLTTADSCV